MEVITQDMVVKATTDAIRQEFTELTESLAAIAERSERSYKFSAVTSTLSEGAQHVLRLLSTKEQQHIDHVRETLGNIPAYPKERKPHDHTKDALYYFVTSAKFACKVTGSGLDMLFQQETSRHYREEAHHPEYEGIHGTECGRNDILEMAVDRMSRSIQASGHVDPDNMKRYMPRFPLGDNSVKQEEYMSYVEEYKNITEVVYWRMFKK